jgi:hypothetical protein
VVLRYFVHRSMPQGLATWDHRGLATCSQVKCQKAMLLSRNAAHMISHLTPREHNVQTVIARIKKFTTTIETTVVTKGQHYYYQIQSEGPWILGSRMLREVPIQRRQ